MRCKRSGAGGSGRVSCVACLLRIDPLGRWCCCALHGASGAVQREHTYERVRARAHTIAQEQRHALQKKATCCSINCMRKWSSLGFKGERPVWGLPDSLTKGDPFQEFPRSNEICPAVLRPLPAASPVCCSCSEHCRKQKEEENTPELGSDRRIQ